MTYQNPISPSAPMRFRWALGILACILALQGLTILVSEVIRPPQREFPATADAAAKRAEDRSGAIWSARFSILRSDLWAEAAATYADAIWTADQSSPDATKLEAIAEARALAESAASRSPHDGRVWLILSALYATTNWQDARAAESLKMAYYTRPNEVTLIPARIFASLHREIIDSDLQLLVRQDIRTIIKSAPDLKNSILVAGANPTPEGARLLETTLKDLDPSLLATLLSNRQHH